MQGTISTSQHTLTGRNRLIIQYLAHELCQRHWQGIRLRMSQTDGRTALGITISNEHLLSFTGKVNAEIHAGSGLTCASLLIDNPIIDAFILSLRSFEQEKTPPDCSDDVLNLIFHVTIIAQLFVQFCPELSKTVQSCPNFSSELRLKHVLQF